MENSYTTPFKVRFKSLEKDGKYYRLDGITEISDPQYDMYVNKNLEGMSKEEIEVFNKNKVGDFNPYDYWYNR